MNQQSEAINKAADKGLWRRPASPSLPTLLPKSKTQRLAVLAKSANLEAEQAISKAYQIEIARTRAVGEAMLKSGKALRLTVESSSRQIYLRTEAARRQYEPGYRNR